MKKYIRYLKNVETIQEIQKYLKTTSRSSASKFVHICSTILETFDIYAFDLILLTVLCVEMTN